MLKVKGVTEDVLFYTFLQLYSKQPLLTDNRLLIALKRKILIICGRGGAFLSQWKVIGPLAYQSMLRYVRAFQLLHIHRQCVYVGPVLSQALFIVALPD